MRATLLALPALLAAAVATAQTPGDAPAETRFAAAMIRINTSGLERTDAQFSPGGRLAITNTTIRDLIRVVFGVSTGQVDGGPEWLLRERYDIVATAGADLPRPQVIAMLRALIVERMKLAHHFEMRPQPAYALRIARADRRLGPQLRTSSTDCAANCGFDLTGGSLTARGMSAASLAQRLAAVTGRPVVDETGLTAVFDLQLHWSPETITAGGDGPSLFTALREQLGLRLDDHRLPVQVLVIDSAERPE